MPFLPSFFCCTLYQPRLNLPFIKNVSNLKTAYAQNKLAPLYNGPYKIIAKPSQNVYELDLPKTMNVNPRQNIANLRKLSSFEAIARQFNDTREVPTERFSVGLITIADMLIKMQEDNSCVLYDTVADYGEFLASELCERGHFAECHRYLMRTKLKPIFSAGDVVTLGEQHDDEIITAYVPYVPIERRCRVECRNPERSA